MQTALILEYQKSVGLHTRSHLHIPWRATGSLDHIFGEATGSLDQICGEATGSALPCVQAQRRMRIDRFRVLPYEGDSNTPLRRRLASASL